MKRPRDLILLLTVFFIVFSAAMASAEKPIDVIQTGVDKVFGILNDPAYAPEGKKDEQRDKIWTVIRSFFDFDTIAKGTLRRHDWDRFTEDQKKEFIDLFTDLIGETYLERIQGEYKNEKVVYGEQEMLSDSKAVVKTTIVRESLEIPVDYRLYLKNGNWRIYNVYVENTSLVTNYRDQFSRILMKGTPAELIEKLREKTIKSEG